MPNNPKTRILFDASILQQGQKTGIGYFSDQLLTHLAHVRDAQVTVVSFDDKPSHRSSSLPTNTRKKIIHGLSFRFYRKLLSLGIRLPLYVGSYDVAIYPNFYSLPLLRSRKKIIIVHDLAYKALPETVEDRNRVFLDKVVGKSLREATGVVTVSAFTKNELLHYYPFLDQGRVLSLDIPPRTLSNHQVDTTEKTNLTKLGIKDNYLLFVGTLEPRKNIINLIDAYKKLPPHTRKNYQLVLAGKFGWKSTKIQEAIHMAIQEGYGIVATGYLSSTTLDLLYRQATAVVMPSLYEGFGMPITEAFLYKKVVIANDLPVFHEVGKDACLFADAMNPEVFSQAIDRALNNAQLRELLVSHGDHALRSMSWERNVKTLLEWIDSL